LNPDSATGRIIRRLHQFLRERAYGAHAVRLEETKEIRIPIAEARLSAGVWVGSITHFTP
jgi:hypothetical protein